jgi:hypothetical protein
MKRLIRNKKTQQYLTSNGTWTADHRAAMFFASGKAAQATWLAQGLQDSEEILILGDEPSAQYDIIVPLPFPCLTAHCPVGIEKPK